MIASRQTKYKSPNQHLADLDARRKEIMEQAPAQAAALGLYGQDVIEAMVKIDAVKRAKGDEERAMFIFELEMEMIQRDQVLVAIEKLTTIVKEAAAEILAAGSDYKTVAEEAECN